MPPTKSVVWRYFHKRENGHAICKFCSKKIKTSGNTSNLLGHVERWHKNHISKESDVHPNINEVVLEEQEPSTSKSNEVHNSNVEKMKVVLNEDSNSLSQASTLTLASNSSQFDASFKTGKKRDSSTIDKCFKNITGFQRGGQKEMQITNALLFMLCKDNLPLVTVENEGFKYLLQKALPLYKIPCRKTFSKLLNSKYDVLALGLKQKLTNYNNFNLTADIWTETTQTKSYLGVTLHYLENVEIQNLNLGVYPLEDRHTSEYIGVKLEETLVQWGLSKEKITNIVTDNAANMTKAISNVFSEKQHLPCFAHTINLVIDNSFKAAKNISSIISRVKTIVTFFKHSVSAADKLRTLQIEAGIAEARTLKLKQEVQTRWNSKFYMIERFLHLAKYVAKISIDDPKAPDMINGNEMELLRELKYLLRPFEITTKELCGEKYITISKIIPIIRCLEEAIIKFLPSHQEVQEFKDQIMQQIQVRFGKIEKVEKLAIGTLMDPRFKKIHFQDYLAVGSAVNSIKRKAKEFSMKSFNHRVEDEIQLEVEVNTDDVVQVCEDDNFNIWNYHKLLVSDFAAKANKEEKDEIDSLISQELTHFLSQPVSDLKDNPFYMWQTLKQTYPHLYDVALQYLQNVATSVPSERLFSKTGHIINDRRSSIKPEKLNKMVFLSSLSKDDWNLS